MTHRPLLLPLCGLGVLTVATLGAVTSSVPADAADATDTGGFTTTAAVTTTVRAIRISSGPALDGRRIELTLLLRAGAGTDVTDLLPPGVRYVAGTSTLTSRTGAKRVGAPETLIATTGTILDWTGITVPKGTSSTLTFAVHPTGPHEGSWSWTDRASISPVSPVSPLSPASVAAALAASRQPDATRRTIEVVPLWAEQTGVVRPTPHASGTAAPAGTQHLVEQVHLETGSAAPPASSTLDVYLPDIVKWVGCTTAAVCTRPSIEHIRARTQPGHPDLPLLTPATPVPSGPEHTFTVLSWHLRSLPAYADVGWTYGLDALDARVTRTQDLVVTSDGPASSANSVSTATVQTWPLAPRHAAPQPRHPSGIPLASLHADVAPTADATRPAPAATTQTRAATARPDTAAKDGAKKAATTPARDPFGGSTATPKPSSTSTKKSTTTATKPPSKSPAADVALATTGGELSEEVDTAGFLIASGIGLALLSRRPRRGSRARRGRAYRSANRMLAGPEPTPQSTPGPEQEPDYWSRRLSLLVALDSGHTSDEDVDLDVLFGEGAEPDVSIISESIVTCSRISDLVAAPTLAPASLG